MLVAFQAFDTYLPCSSLFAWVEQNIHFAYCLYFVILIIGGCPSKLQSAILPFWFNYCFRRLPRFENEFSIVVAVHAEVEEDLAGARDEDGSADDAPVHASEEEQEHGEGGEGEPRVEVEGG